MATKTNFTNCTNCGANDFEQLGNVKICTYCRTVSHAFPSKNNTYNINTFGGNVINGNVTVETGDYIGRSKIFINKR